MANPNHALLSLCLLLSVAGALAATTTTEAASRRRLQEITIDPNEPEDSLQRNNGFPSIPGPIVPLPPAAVACWKSILASRECVDDLLDSLARLELRVSKVCCSVLEKIGDRCVVSAFSSFPFNPLFPPVVKRVCSLAA